MSADDRSTNEDFSVSTIQPEVTDKISHHIGDYVSFMKDLSVKEFRNNWEHLFLMRKGVNAERLIIEITTRNEKEGHRVRQLVSQMLSRDHTVITVASPTGHLVFNTMGDLIGLTSVYSERTIIEPSPAKATPIERGYKLTVRLSAEDFAVEFLSNLEEELKRNGNNLDTESFYAAPIY